MDADTIFLALRVIVALGVVLAVLWILRRRLSKGAAKPAARKAGARRAPLSLFGRAPQGPTAAVRGRHALGQKSSVAVVEFDGREFLLGVTEHGVTVLHQAGSDEEVDGVDDLQELPIVEPVAVVATEPDVVAPATPAVPEALAPEVLAPEAPAPEPVAGVTAAAAPVAEPAPDWAALFARELVAAQQAVAAEQAAAVLPQAAPAPAPGRVSAPAAEPQPVAPVWAAAHPGAVHEPATVFAPRYARSTAPTPDIEDEIDPASGLVPQPLPVRTVITGQFIAEVELMPLPTSAIPIIPTAVVPTAAVPAAAVAPPAPAPAPLAPAPAPAPAPVASAARPAPASAVLPITAMFPAITIPARPAPAPIPAPAAATVPQPEPVAVGIPAPASVAQSQPHPERRPTASPLAGSILSPDTWRQTVDAFRQLR